jgi:nitrite reductase/ring-hydroxylating ferredoxin subunit
MRGLIRNVTRYADRLLRQRRPRPFVPTDAEAEALTAAIYLRAGRPEDAIPRAEFIAALHDRLAERAARADEQADEQPMPGEASPRPSRLRRDLLIGTASAAASAAVVASADRLLTGAVPGTSPDVTPDATLEPNDGTWQTILAAGDLAEGAVAAFDTGTVAGFVARAVGGLSARSGVCTHQGCRLTLQLDRLACPCHRTFFNLDGTVITSQLPAPPPRLPAIEVREHGGTIQVRVPRSSP